MNAKLQNLLQKLSRDERGLSTVEYVVLLVLIVIMCVALWNMFGNTVADKLTAAGTEFDEEVATDRRSSNNDVDDTAGDFATPRGAD